MSTKNLFSPDDLALLRRPTSILVVALVVAVVSYLVVSYLNTNATNRYQFSQNQFVQIQTSIQQIASEETTFVEYIDRYRMMVEDEVFAEEDRLSLLESVQAIRREGRLFPVTVDIESQGSSMLQYSPAELVPGQPVELRFSTVKLEFDSLHEDDFTHLVSEFLSGLGLFVPIACLLDSDAGDEGFEELGPNLNAVCEFIWFTLNLNPVVSTDAV